MLVIRWGGACKAFSTATLSINSYVSVSIHTHISLSPPTLSPTGRMTPMSCKPYRMLFSGTVLCIQQTISNYLLIFCHRNVCYFCHHWLQLSFSWTVLFQFNSSVCPSVKLVLWLQRRTFAYKVGAGLDQKLSSSGPEYACRMSFVLWNVHCTAWYKTQKHLVNIRLLAC